MRSLLLLVLPLIWSCTDPMGSSPGGSVAAGRARAELGANTPALDADLDLREANVMAVTFDPRKRRFAVTILHDDSGEYGFANWWQVETLTGIVLGRHKILSGHGTHPFTTEKEIHLMPGTTHVVVRAHDSTHGFGGRAMVYHIETGASTPVDQGSEPRSFADFQLK